MNQDASHQAIVLPQFPGKSASTVLSAPLLATCLFLALGRWGVPVGVYGAGTSMLLMAFCALTPSILAFPVNARGELGHRLELARCAGTSWFADMRAEGRCSLLEIGEASLRANQCCVQWAGLFAAAAAAYGALGVAIAAGTLSGWFAPTAAFWIVAVCTVAAAHIGWLAARFRRFGPLAPNKQQVLNAASLHQLCDSERRAELISLVKKS